MAIESHVAAVGRKIAASPLWTGLAITLFFVLPTVIVPSIPLWFSAVFALVIGPPILLGCFLLYGVARRLKGVVEPGETADSGSEAQDPVDRLKERYANGEIDDATFERHLELVIETESLENSESTPERIRNK